MKKKGKDRQKSIRRGAKLRERKEIFMGTQVNMEILGSQKLVVRYTKGLRKKRIKDELWNQPQRKKKRGGDPRFYVEMRGAGETKLAISFNMLTRRYRTD